MKTSKFIKVDKDIIIEWVYDSENFILEAYKILTNFKDEENSFISVDSSVTDNTQKNQLFPVDLVKNIWAKVDTERYGFLQVRDWGASTPIRFDKIIVHLPVNYNFGNYLGFHIKVFSTGSKNPRNYNLSNLYFDVTNQEHQKKIKFNSPPLLIGEKLWQKSIEFLIPSLHFISNQKTLGRPTDFSLNYNLTDGIGMSVTSPIFVDFSFINSRFTLQGEERFILAPKRELSIAQSPEWENISVKIEESRQGDFFEIYGTYNGTSAEFAQFIETSIYEGRKYNVEFVITIFEQNVRTRSQKIYLDEYFSDKIEFRPVIRSSSSTAIIDCEMRMINLGDDSVITKRASLGMLPDQVSKYSINLSKINLSSASNPKIYAIKNPLGAGILELNDKRNQSQRGRGGMDDFFNSQIKLEFITVPTPVFIDKFNLVAKSDSVEVGTNFWYSDGALRIVIYPFDNVIKFVIAQRVSESQVEYMDLSNSSDVRLVFKNELQTISFPLWDGNSGVIDLQRGTVCFRVTQSRIPDLEKIFNTGRRVFYITTTNNDITIPIFSGTFIMFDSLDYIDELLLRNQAEEAEITEEDEGDLVIAVPETDIELLFAGGTTSSNNNSNQVLPPSTIIPNNIPPNSTPATTLGLLYRNNTTGDSTSPYLIYKVITSADQVGTIMNLSADGIDPDSKQFTSLEFRRNSSKREKLIFPNDNQIKGTDITDELFDQLVEIAIVIPKSSLGSSSNIFPKAIKLNNQNQFRIIEEWRSAKLSSNPQYSIYKFSLELKPTDILDVYIDFENGDSSRLSGFVNLPNFPQQTLPVSTSVSDKKKIKDNIQDIQKNIYPSDLQQESKKILNIPSDELELQKFQNILKITIEDLKRRGLYDLSLPCNSGKLLKVLNLTELCKTELRNQDEKLRSCPPTDKECKNSTHRIKLSWIEIIDQVFTFIELCP